MMRQSILSVGECMVELSPDGPSRYRQAFAGDTFNTAWYLRRLLPRTWRVGFATCVGEDAVSKDMLRFMKASGIETEAIRRLPGLTVGLYMIHLAAGERTFTYWRGASAARHLAANPDVLLKLVSGHGLVFLSGVTLAILPPAGRAALLSCLRTVRETGSIVAFDPNLRPALWQDIATMRHAIVEAAGVADVVLPSFDEESAHFGDKAPQDTIARYQQSGAVVVVVKNADKPSVAWDSVSGTTAYSPDPVTPRDTTAAGDAFNAGFLAARLQGSGLISAVEAGAALARKVVQAPGALVACEV
jgi:2-dehydro-3-deoxygluconokinase